MLLASPPKRRNHLLKLVSEYSSGLQNARAEKALQKTLTSPDADESCSQVPSCITSVSASLPMEYHHPQDGLPEPTNTVFTNGNE
ncbi:hypothetical protein AAES_133472 [Amazona aestiva]|uniref:Uncharacterized protein n=1 Tax=Amazona aestiva TaxID=12930 RepID=A0A0Q3P751_AMAAE|nr:hypothetical protein AAES_133472 [Amazona aestiva]